MTHGHIIIKGPDDNKLVHLYTHHDGHASEAIDMLMTLPFTVFNAGKKSSLETDLLERDEEGRIKNRPPQADLLEGGYGPWFYDVFGPKDAKSTTRNDNKIYKAREDVFRAYRSSRMGMEIYPVSLANWIVWRRFGHWFVVPDKSYCTYPDPDLILTINKNDEYVVENRHKYDAEHHKESTTSLLNRVNQLNDHVPALKASGQQNGIWLEHRHGGLLPKVHVPFIGIFLELLWLDHLKAADSQTAKSTKNT